MSARLPPRVLLLHPDAPRERTYPLGLAYLASAARNTGATVLGLDLRVRPLRALRVMLRRQRFDYVAITALSTTVDRAAALVTLVRRMHPAAFVVLGGPHATLAPRDALTRTRADGVVRGDGERPLAALLSGALDGPGLMLRGSSSTPPIHVHEDLDTLALPDRTIFPVDAYYREGVLGAEKRSSLVATRGCSLDCGFCSAKALSRGTFRTRSADSVVDEIRRLRSVHGVHAIVFEDDNLFLDSRWYRALFEKLAREVPGMRYDLPNGVHPGLIDEAGINVLARAGVRSLAFGVESVSAADREALGRTFDLGHLERLCSRARRAGIVTTGYFLVGLPDQSTRSALLESLAFRSLPFDMVHVSVLQDLPGQLSAGVPSLAQMRAWQWVRRGMYASWYAEPRRSLRLLKLTGGNPRALSRLAARMVAWW